MSAVFWFFAALPWLFLADQIIDAEIVLAYACYGLTLMFWVMAALQLMEDNDVRGAVRRMRQK